MNAYFIASLPRGTKPLAENKKPRDAEASMEFDDPLGGFLVQNGEKELCSNGIRSVSFPSTSPLCFSFLVPRFHALSPPVSSLPRVLSFHVSPVSPFWVGAVVFAVRRDFAARSVLQAFPAKTICRRNAFWRESTFPPIRDASFPRGSALFYLRTGDRLCPKRNRTRGSFGLL